MKRNNLNAAMRKAKKLAQKALAKGYWGSLDELSYSRFIGREVAHTLKASGWWFSININAWAPPA